MDSIANLILESSARRLSVDGQALDLTTVEFDILACLVRSAGAVVARDRLMSEAFARAANPEDRALDVHISHLRKKLGAYSSLIVTIRGVGHLLRAYPVSAAAEDNGLGKPSLTNQQAIADQTHVASS